MRGGHDDTNRASYSIGNFTEDIAGLAAPTVSEARFAEVDALGTAVTAHRSGRTTTLGVIMAEFERRAVVYENQDLPQPFYALLIADNHEALFRTTDFYYNKADVLSMLEKYFPDWPVSEQPAETTGSGTGTPAVNPIPPTEEDGA
jgi:hypothetical protein